MSKKDLKKYAKLNKVMAIPSKVIKNAKGEIVKQLYNIVKLG